MAPSRVLRVLHVGYEMLVRYGDGLRLQDALYAARRKASTPDTLVLLQHHPVYTIGKRGSDSDFKITAEELVARGAETWHAPRGGEVTFHGPRQLVAYPVLDIREAKIGARAFVECLEDCVVDTLGKFEISGRGRVTGATGVWVGERKIAAIGVKLSHGVSTHGLALNVDTDLSSFDAIVPCGIADKEVTSIAAEVARAQHPPQSRVKSARVATSGHLLSAFAAEALYNDATNALLAAFARRLRYSTVMHERVNTEVDLNAVIHDDL
mmetsp:Transcript_19883/g.59051  ORF Transcript_19883/g.59051 Transcript_19883/m.59051 type:complete len:267 (-) Transcript_19883:17-817(-)